MSLEYILLIGFLYSVIVAGFPIYLIVDLMWNILHRHIQKPKKSDKVFPRQKYQSVILGIVDRSLYITSLLILIPEFIGIWLTLKTVSLSKRWSDDGDIGRAAFNNFLAGNGLNILFSVAGVGIIRWLAGPTLLLEESAKSIPAIFLKTNFMLAYYACAVPLALSTYIYLFLVFVSKYLKLTKCI